MSNVYTSGPQGSAIPLTREQQLERAVAAVRALHRAGRTGPERKVECTYCVAPWPCDTIAAIDSSLT